MSVVADHAPKLRASLRAEVALASDVLVPAWPISSFIAVNPLGGLEEFGFEEATRRAAAAMGTRGHLDESHFRALAADGRITEADLGVALRRRHPEALEPDAVRLGSATLTPTDILVLDLLHAPPAPRAATDMTVGERTDALLGTRIAAAVDDEACGWCAAFLDEGQASWSMPGRERGLYAAWRVIASHDRGLRRLGAGDLRGAIGALPENPADALAAGLETLGVSAERRAVELRRQLGRRPGWASAIRWRSEHHSDGGSAPADLTDLLALRVSLEALLVERAAERAFGAGAPMAELLGALRAQNPAGAGDDGTEARLEAVAHAAGAGWPLDAEQRRGLTAVLASIAPSERPAVWQAAYEEHWRAPLLGALSRPAAAGLVERPRAQVVCCIDARSEGLRRHLEATGPYETLGFAGFFAVAMRFRRLGSDGGDALCPVLLTPRNDVTELVADGEDALAERWLDGGRARAAGTRTLHHVREDLATPFALAEASGWLMGPQALARTLVPGAYDRGRSRVIAGEAPATRMAIDRPTPQEAEEIACAQEHELVRELVAARLGRGGRNATAGDVESLRRRAIGVDEPGGPFEALRLGREREHELLRALREDSGITGNGHGDRVAQAATLGFTRAEQIATAATALRMMGLVRGFGRLVLLCGHGSVTENNPYEAALDCGACGGNHGGPNARVAAAMLNRAYVRDALRLEGIEVPEDTWFVAGQHDTAADTVSIFDRDTVPAAHRDDLAALEADLRIAGAGNSAERLARLPGALVPRDTGAAHRRAGVRGRDWAQIRPEWGLARNGAFIVGSRAITTGLDLECRSFLHSYDAEVDTDGAMLETILTAPLVVAQWINCQYYFSTVDPERLGAGNKTIHNVVAGLGVLQGPGGDLKLGLPVQGALDGERLYHEPMRLLAIVEAPLARIDDIVRRNPILQHLFGGEWVAVAAREHPDDPWLRRAPAGEWIPWNGQAPPAPVAAPGGAPAARRREQQEVAA